MTTDSNVTTELSKLTSANYPLFADYCNYLDKGLRKDALKCLEDFLDNTKNWDYIQKANFCKTIFDAFPTANNDIDFILTSNLRDKLIRPTLLEMTTREPDNYKPFKWYGQYFGDTPFIKKAYLLNPSDNSVKVILLKALEHDLWLSTHHLPEGYIGNIQEDESDIDLAFSVLKTLDATMAGNFLNVFNEVRNEIVKYKSNGKMPSH